MVIAECKSGVTGPLDRIFWLSGVKNFVDANEAFLVRKGTKWNIKDFAKTAGVQVFDTSRLSELEITFRISEHDWPGISDREYFQTKIDGWNKSLAGNPQWWELYMTLRGEVRFLDPFPAINYTLQQLRLLSRAAKPPSAGSIERFLLAESISQLLVFLMRVAEHSFDLSPEDRSGYIRKGLTYGSLDPRFADRILNSAYNLTRQAILHYTDKVKDIDRQLFRMPVPPGSDEVVAAVDLILRAYPSSLDLPQICDLLLTEVFVKGNRNGGWMKRIFHRSELTTRVDLVRSFLQLLARAGACPADLPDLITSNSTASPDAAPPPTGEAVLTRSDAKPANAMDSKPDSPARTPDRNTETLKSNNDPQDPHASSEFALKPPALKD